MSRESVFFSHFSKWFDVTKNENLSAIRTPLTPPFLYETRFTFFLRYAHDTHTCAIQPIFAFIFFAVVVCASLISSSSCSDYSLAAPPRERFHDEKIIHEHETNSLGGSQRREETRRRTDETRRSKQRRRRGCKTTNSLEQEGFLRSTTDEYE